MNHKLGNPQIPKLPSLPKIQEKEVAQMPLNKLPDWYYQLKKSTVNDDLKIKENKK